MTIVNAAPWLTLKRCSYTEAGIAQAFKTAQMSDKLMCERDLRRQTALGFEPI